MNRIRDFIIYSYLSPYFSMLLMVTTEYLQSVNGEWIEEK